MFDEDPPKHHQLDSVIHQYIIYITILYTDIANLSGVTSSNFLANSPDYEQPLLSKRRYV